MVDEKYLSITKGEVFEKAYSLDNYKIIDYQNDTNKCVIYFSGSSIYYPNTEAQLGKMIETDYYEWTKTKIFDVKREIYVRDVTKQFYVEGINKKINTIDKLIKILKKETELYDDVTMIGCSAGAYMAALAGALLEANRVYCFSAFFSLDDVNQEIWYMLKKNENVPERKKYYNIVKYIKEAKNTKFFYVYPGLSKDLINNDSYQSTLVEGIGNVYTFRMKEKGHGTCMRKETLQAFVNYNENDLIYLSKKKRMFKETFLMKNVLGLRKTAYLVIRDLWRSKIKSKIFK